MKSSNEVKTVHTLQKVFDLEKVSFKIGDAMSNLPLSPQITSYNGKRMAYFYDVFLHQIIGIDLDKRAVTEYIRMEEEGPDGFRQIGGFGIADSLFLVYDNVKYVMSIDHQGRIHKRLNIENFDPKSITKEYRFNGHPLQQQSLGDSAFVCFPSPLNKGIYEAERLFSIVDWKKGLIRLSEVPYPAQYTTESTFYGVFYAPLYQLFQKSLLIHFTFTSEIHRYNFETKEVDLIKVPTTYTDALPPQSLKKGYNNPKNIIDEIARFPCYHPLLYDSHRQLFYRLINKPEADTPEPVSPNYVKIACVLLVMDTDLNLLAEIDMGNTYTPHAFVAEEGLFLRLNGQDESALEMHLLKWKGQ